MPGFVGIDPNTGQVILSNEVNRWLQETATALSRVRPILGKTPLSAEQRYELLHELGQAASRYRQIVYQQDSFTGKVARPVDEVRALLLGAGFYLHTRLRKLAARGVIKWLSSQARGRDEELQLLGGFSRSTRIWRSLFNVTPAGWGRRSRHQLARVVGDTDRFVQRLNDSFANPSGSTASVEPVAAPAEGNVKGAALVQTVGGDAPHG